MTPLMLNRMNTVWFLHYLIFFFFLEESECELLTISSFIFFLSVVPRMVSSFEISFVLSIF